jgi:hypothetical protein
LLQVNEPSKTRNRTPQLRKAVAEQSLWGNLDFRKVLTPAMKKNISNSCDMLKTEYGSN